jgi:hypothetical protein
VCTAAGSPGSWFKLTTSVVPVAPFRVDDSRFVDGPLAKWANRVVSVKDPINVTTGAVATTNAEPTGAAAVFFNLTITRTLGGGFLAA